MGNVGGRGRSAGGPRYSTLPGRGSQALPVWSARNAYKHTPSGTVRRVPPLEAEPQADPVPDRILVVTAHPDDVDFGAAGSVAAWTAAGAHVTYCVVTDGDAGGFDPTVDRSQIPAIRRAEQTGCGGGGRGQGPGVARLPGWPGGGDPRPAPRPGPGDPPGPARTGSSARARSGCGTGSFASHPDHLAVGRGHDLRGVPRRPQPVRLSRAGRRGPRGLRRSRSCGSWPPRAPTSTWT